MPTRARAGATARGAAGDDDFGQIVIVAHTPSSHCRSMRSALEISTTASTSIGSGSQQA
jgi:hypothetical protein